MTYNVTLLTKLLDNLDKNLNDESAMITWRHDVVPVPASVTASGYRREGQLLWGMDLRTDGTELRDGSVALAQKHDAIRLKFGMDVDQQVYVGDVDYSITGLLNDARVEVCDVDGPLIELASPGVSPCWSATCWACTTRAGCYGPAC